MNDLQYFEHLVLFGKNNLVLKQVDVLRIFSVTVLDILLGDTQYQECQRVELSKLSNILACTYSFTTYFPKDFCENFHNSYLEEQVCNISSEIRIKIAYSHFNISFTYVPAEKQSLKSKTCEKISNEEIMLDKV